jgi:replicative DNA helicase
MLTGNRPESDKSRASAMSAGSTDKILERVPPFDEAAEAAVLGSMLMDSRAADIAIEALTPDDFYLPRHRVVFIAFSELFTKHENIDELFLCSELQRQGKLDAAGGKETIGRLILNTPSAAGIESYCQVVRDRAVERELITGAGKILQLVHEPNADGSAALVDMAEKLVFDISDKRNTQEATPMSALMQQTVDESAHFFNERREGREPESHALSTHYPDLDRLLAGGFWPGELVILAGRPSMGKTTFALNIVRQVSVGNETRVKPTAIFSLEMPKEQVAKNILCAQAELDGRKMRRYDFNEEEFERAQFFGKVLQQAPIFIDDTSGISIGSFRARCRRLSHRHKVKLIVVDYLQLMKGTAQNAKGNREQEVAEISRGLKSVARDLRIPIIVLSQLNRSAEKRENDDKKPQLSDLRESGAIEQDADVVIMLYRPDYYNLDGNAQQTNEGEALVLKNRNGPVGSVRLTFRKDILRFDSYVPDHNVAAGE